MDHDEALGHLRLRGEPSEDDIRTSFRQLIRQSHPDVTASVDTAASGAQSQLLITAYRIALEQARRPAVDGAFATAEEPTVPTLPTVPSGSSIERGDQACLADRDTIALHCTAEEAFARMLDVGSLLGAITYLDRQGELIEVMLTTKLGDTVSLVISFQGRAEWVEAFLTTEVLDIARHELPTVGEITELVLHELLRRW